MKNLTAHHITKILGWGRTTANHKHFTKADLKTYLFLLKELKEIYHLRYNRRRDRLKKQK